MTVQNEMQIVIEPDRSWLRFPWRELLQYRDLLFLLVRRDFVSRYKQTLLGPLWFVLQPLMTTVVFTVIFGKVAKLPTDRLPPLLFYLCGMLGWQYFAQCMQGTSTTFVGQAHLFGKVYFPRLIVPLSVVASNLLAFGIQLVTFLAFWGYFKLRPDTGVLICMRPVAALFPLVLILTAAAGLGVGLWMSALTAKYRDFVHLSAFLAQVWLYLTPVVYPLSEVAEGWRWVWALNPMTGIVEFYRYAFLGAGTLRAAYLLISVAATLLLLLSGVLVFNRVERTFIDTV